ncbi:hypothetical protein DPMN_079725 [Dreissena polymorpha]|uniref:Uncharacterized protein n=1 Tax=Dreissena polymorpha TaxID=45954 RepID=A0A9D3YUA3_DREPO|nr:hypothetical protein DPMN_079725 [Dreissena polymorpha]
MEMMGQSAAHLLDPNAKILGLLAWAEVSQELLENVALTAKRKGNARRFRV